MAALLFGTRQPSRMGVAGEHVEGYTSQTLTRRRGVFATKSVVENSQVSKILEAGKLRLTEQSAALRGVADKMAVFQIP